MEKRRCFAAFLTVVFMSGCGTALPAASAGGEETGAGAASGATSALTAAARSEPQISETASATQVEQSGREPTEDEILTAYDRAVTAYGWFDLDTLPCGGPVKIIDGENYQKVEYRGFDTLEDLEIYLSSLFSPKVIDRLLEQDEEAPKYRDIDGALYVHPSGRLRDADKGSAAVTVARQDESTYFVNVTVDLLAGDLSTITGAECFAFPYQLVNGRWVFTEFRLVY